METNNKKSIFSKKNIVIGVCILVILILLIYFIFLREPKEKVMTCTMKIDNYTYAILDLSIDAYYTKKVNRLEGKINFEVTDEGLKAKIEDLEKQLAYYYKQSIKGDSIEINVSREDFNIILNYSIDYDKVKDDDIESFEILSIEGMTKRMTVDELKDQLLNLGGTCVEE